MRLLELWAEYGGSCECCESEMVFGMKSLLLGSIHFIHSTPRGSREFQRIRLCFQDWLEIGKS